MNFFWKPCNFSEHLTPVFFFFFKQGPTSAGRNSAFKTPYPPLPYSESSGRALSHGTTQYMTYLFNSDGDAIPRPQ